MDILEGFFREWWRGIKLIGKLAMFLIVLSIFMMPLSLFEALIAELKQSNGATYAVLSAGYWISVVLFLPLVYSRIGKAVGLIRDEAVANIEGEAIETRSFAAPPETSL